MKVKLTALLPLVIILAGCTTAPLPPMDEIILDEPDIVMKGAEEFPPEEAAFMVTTADIRRINSKGIGSVCNPNSSPLKALSRRVYKFLPGEYKLKFTGADRRGQYAGWSKVELEAGRLYRADFAGNLIESRNIDGSDYRKTLVIY